MLCKLVHVNYSFIKHNRLDEPLHCSILLVAPFTYVCHFVESFLFQQEWAEAKKELQEEKDRVRTLTAEKEKTIETSMKQVEEMRKEMSDAWWSVSLAETRAAVAEVCRMCI